VAATDEAGVRGSYPTAVVRLVRHHEGRSFTAGLGMLVGPRQVVTCAHVVNVALSRQSKWEQSRPDPDVRLIVEFPLVERSPTRTGQVAVWVPPPQKGTGSGDVAGIVLAEDAPPAAIPARLTQSVPAQSRLRVFGYPEDPPRLDGAWVDLDLKGEIGRRLIQVESRAAQTVRAQPGYSGSPVWDDSTGAAVGLLHAAMHPDRQERDAHVLSAQLIAEAWEDQFDYLLVPPNPYHGLAPFTEDDAAMFFGRDRDIDQLANRLATQPVVLVVGPSGVGKSSLVQAGLIPRLRRTQDWSPVVVRPGPEPWHRLAAGLLRVERKADETTLDDIERETQRLKRDGLAPLSRLMRARDKHLLVVVDQFEEALTTGQPPDRSFLGLLFPVEAATSDPLRIVVTLRADYLEALLAVPGIGPRLEERMHMLSPLPEEGLRSAIVDPAAARGVGFEDGLVNQLVEDAHTDALPLLQFTLTRLWDTQRRKTLGWAGYRAIGGVAGALNHFAKQQTASLPPDTERVLDRTLLYLVRTPPGAPGLTTRQRACRSDLPSTEWQVAQHLADARLVTITTDHNHNAYAELAHEALIRSWERLEGLVRENAEFLGWLTWVEQRAEEGDDLPESRVSEALRWLDVRPDSVTEKIKAFIDRSRIAAETRQAEQTRARVTEQARQRALQVAESLRLASEARQAIAAEPEVAFLVAWEAVLRDRNELSEAVFRESLDSMPAIVQELYEADRTAVFVGFADARTIFISEQRTGTLVIGNVDNFVPNALPIPGGDRLIAASFPRGGVMTYRSGTVRLHDPTGAVMCHLKIHDETRTDDSWRGLSFAEHGKCLVHDGDEGWLVNIADDMHEITLEREFRFARGTFGASLDSRGEFIVTEGEGGAQVLATDGSAVTELEGQGFTTASCILADETIVTGTEDGTGTMWDRTGAPRNVFRQGQHGGDLYIRAVDPAKEYFATTTNTGGTVEVWSFTGERHVSLQGPRGDHMWSMAFSSDGTLLATGASDRIIRIWNWRTAGNPTALHGHRDAVHVVAFHPDDPTVLISADQKGAVRLWRLDSPPVPPIPGHRSEIRSLATTNGWTVSADAGTTRAWSRDVGTVALGGALRTLSYAPDGRRTFALVVDSTKTGQLWEVQRGSVPRRYSELPADLRFTGHYDEKVSVAPDGQYLARIEGDGATLWSATGTLVAHVRGENPPDVDADTRGVVRVVFRPDATRLAVAARNGAAWIWSTDGELCATFVTDHSSPDRTFDLDCDPRGEFIAAAMRDRVGFWDWEGNRIGQLNTAGYKVFRVAVSLDGERILTVADNPSGRPAAVPELWARDGTRLAGLDRAPISWSIEPIFDEHQRYILLPDGAGVSIMDWDGAYLARIAGPLRTMLYDSARSPDGDLIAALFSDGITRIWSVPERRRTKSLRMDGARRIAFSANGQLLLAGTDTGLITCHALDVEALFEPGAQRVSRTLIRDELERFGIDSPRLDAEALQRYQAGGT
jgi:WD40 repeat protein/V8-like Glu-specific endopeptidase